ncbi:MAG TPA: hypothetical protein VLF91_02065 [Candidatus Saccharimonadales bacterium]|nr:hypothetical protein [Candidatus Saccharimonadales bacterium]
MTKEKADKTEDSEPERAVAEHAGNKHARTATAPRSADESSVEAVNDTADKVNDKPVAKTSGNQLMRLWSWSMGHRKVSIPAAAALLVVLLAAVPFTRYALAGMVLRQSFSVVVADSQTHQPISSALVALHGATALTDSKGQAKLHVKVGSGTLVVSKKYYAQSGLTVTVPIGRQRQALAVGLKATGRQVPITVLNKISGKPVANASIKALGTEAKTDKNGQTVLVLPADKTSASATVASGGYNTATVTVTVTAQVVKENTFNIVPAGKVYFLSNLSGKIDVVKTNLDGSDRQTVLTGTGKEIPESTVLIATTDWKHLALLSRRDGGDNDKLYLIDTSNDHISTIDEGPISFTLYGWEGHNFVYSIRYDGYAIWANHAQVLKAFNADSGKITVLDQTLAEGSSTDNYLYEYYSAVYLLDDQVFYAKSMTGLWSLFTGNAATVSVIKADGSGKNVLKSYTVPAPVTTIESIYLSTAVPKPDTIYFTSSGNTNDTTVYVYDGKQVQATTKQTTYTDGDSSRSSYLYSPSGSSTLWTEQRDGKNALLVGDEEGANGQLVAGLSGYGIYGWFTDDYLLISKDNSELYIVPASGGTPLKVTDYFRADQIIRGYGGGY